MSSLEIKSQAFFSGRRPGQNSEISVPSILPMWAVNAHPNGATHDRRNGAIFKWAKSGSRTGSKLRFFTHFQTAFFRLIPTTVF